MNCSVALLFSITSPEEFPFTDKISRDSYHLLSKLGRKRNIDVRFVLGEDYKEGKFQSYWKFKDDLFVHCKESFIPSQIYLQTRDNKYEYTKRINNPFLEIACRDKYITAQLFPKYCKKTILVTKDSSVVDFITNHIVIKPQFGSYAENVQIISKEDYNPDLYLSEKYVAQEFIESSTGILGLIDKRHELRMYIFSGEIKAAYLRIPKEKSFIANIAKGGKEQLFDLSLLPKEVLPLKEYVDARFSHIFPRLYTIDVMFENGSPWIVELNDTPGMPDIRVQPFTDNYLQEMLTLFESTNRYFI